MCPSCVHALISPPEPYIRCVKINVLYDLMDLVGIEAMMIFTLDTAIVYMQS